jgi:hypothetical protein
MVTLRLTERAARTRELHCWNVRANRSEASWHLTERTELRRLLNCLEANPSVNTARNNTCFVVIVGYHGNPVYRAVAWIPICVCVTWLPKFLTCGRFQWEAPTLVFKLNSTQLKQIWDSKIPTGNNIWSQVPQGYSIPRHIDWLTDCQS